MIAKPEGSPYQPGERCGDWVNLKLERQKMRAAELRATTRQQAIDGACKGAHNTFSVELR